METKKTFEDNLYNNSKELVTTIFRGWWKDVKNTCSETIKKIKKG